MEASIIFTFDGKDQEFANETFTYEQLDDKKLFFKRITRDLGDDSLKTLVKVSCCLYGATIPNPYHWYLKSGGKLWDDEIPQLVKDVWGIESTITPVNI